MMIKEFIYALTQFKIPLYSLLAVVMFMAYINYNKSVSSEIKVSFMTSMFTVLLIMGFGLTVLTYPQTAGVEFHDIRKATKSIEEVSSDYYNRGGSYVDPKEVDWLADRLWRKCDQKVSCFKNKAYNYVRSRIDYASDKVVYGHDKWLKPSQTLAMGEGDCEDHSFLLASILKNKIKAQVVHYPNHMAVGVCEGENLVRYDSTKPRLTGSVINQTKEKIKCEK